jgi:hypothetical protein
VVLPGWDISDEDRYDEQQTRKKKRAARKKAGAIKRRRTSPATNKTRTQGTIAQSEGEAKQ